MEISKEIITENINNPRALEDLYQTNKKTFMEIIKSMYEQDSNLIIEYWYMRLFYKPVNKKRNSAKFLFTAVLVILTWIPVRLNFIDHLSYNLYFVRVVPIIFSIALSFFFLSDFKNIKKIVLCILPNILLYIYFILLPGNADFKSQSLTNAFLFMLIMLWFFVLFTYSNFNIKKLNYFSFLEKTGETLIWSTIFIIGGGVVVVLFIALFNAIKIDAFNFYRANIITLGLTAAPFVSLLVVENYSKIKLSAIIANVFLPIILVSLVAFGIISIFAEIKPYENRDIFILYNIMLVIVIAVLVFSGITKINNKFINICSYSLSVVAVILDVITISAVIYRLSNYGITPNKITLLGTNIIMLTHLVYMIYLKLKHKSEQAVSYLPIYFIWASIFVFVFPFVFKFA